MEQFLIYIVLVSCATASVGGNLTCLSCKDSPLPRDCQYAEKCGPHEVCYSSAYVTSAGVVRHDLGCRDINKCSSVVAARSANNFLTCSDCCNGTLCNSGLCGQTGIPQLSPSVRGPICYSCDQQLYPDTCHVIKECSRDEVCMLSRFKSQVGHDVLYQTKCARQYECGNNQYQAIVGKKRSNIQSGYTANCDLKCCTTDLCNSDCSGGQGVVSSTNSTSTTQSTTVQTSPGQTTMMTNATTNGTQTTSMTPPSNITAGSSLTTVTATNLTLSAAASSTTTPTATGLNSSGPTSSAAATTGQTSTDTGSTFSSASTTISVTAATPTTPISSSTTTSATTTIRPTSSTATTSTTTTLGTTKSSTMTPTTATPPTTTQSTTAAARTTVSASCKDSLSICDRYKPTYCNSKWGLHNCRRTCGLCNVPLNTHCIDQTICNALSLTSCNTDYGLNDCIRSCNRC